MFPKLRHIARANEIVGTFARHGFSTLLKSSGLTQFLPVNTEEPEGTANQANAEALRTICEELGPTFIKLGQVVSTRPDLLPPEYTAELVKLQDSAAPIDPQIIRDVIENELGAPPEDIFLTFNQQPLASASIGQVHKAVLKDGTRVVVKVQRPGVAETIAADMEIMRAAAHFVDRRSEVIHKKYDLPGVVEDFANTLLNELSYRREGRNAERLRQNIKSDSNPRSFYIPKVFWDYTTDLVICWEELTGYRIEEIDAIADRLKLRRAELAVDFLNNYLQQIFIDGYYHADPHPGNLRILESGRIGLMDFGMMGSLTREQIDIFANTISALVEKDSFSLATALLELAGQETHDVDFKRFRSDISAYIQTYYSTTMNDVPFGQAFNDLIELSARSGLRLPGELAILSKTMWNMEIVARKLDPNANTIEVLKPFSGRLLRERLTPQHLQWTIIKGLLDWRGLISELPERSKKLMEKIEEGRFRMELEYRGLEQFSQNVLEVGRALSISVVMAGALLSGALLSRFATPSGLPWVIAIMAIAGGAGYLIGAWVWRISRRL
ncbi:MAG: ABC1 kinase family protein [Candidatus Xenobia bacterium]